MENTKVWLVTGSSKGLGNELVKKLLEKGYRVAATSRTVKSLEAQFGAESGTFLPLALNIANEGEVKRAVEAVRAKFGRIDVAVNNAGFTHLATIEEMSDRDARAVRCEYLRASECDPRRAPDYAGAEKRAYL